MSNSQLHAITQALIDKPCTRAELSAAADMTLPRISCVLTGLVDGGYVEFVGYGHKAEGAPGIAPNLYRWIKRGE